MTILSQRRPQSSAGRERIDSASRYLRGWIRQLRTWHSQRRASRQLLSLTDAQLKDIGLHRSEVNRAIVEGDGRLRYSSHPSSDFCRRP